MLQVSAPIPRQTVGRTFVVAISVLGAVAFLQIMMLAWAFVKGPRTKPIAAAPTPANPSQEKIADPFASAATTSIPHAPEIPRELPRPKPVDFSQPTPQPMLTAKSTVAPAPNISPAEARVNDLIEIARTLRARGDTATTITRLREAQAIQPQNVSVLFELATTYEKMGLGDKAAEQWRKIYEIGESAGPFYAAAESKLRAAQAMAQLQTAAASQPAPAAASQSMEGFQPGALLALTDVSVTPQVDPNSMQKLLLRIPIKARPKTKIDVRDVIIHVDFYDAIDGQNIVRTNANVSSHWTTLPVDWNDDDVELLEVEYSQPKLDVKRAAEGRKYYGYIVRVYYKGDLQDTRAEPVALLKQYPPPLKLAEESK